jgi:adenine-specific DNA-methyltransferase
MLVREHVLRDFEQILGAPYSSGDGYAIYCADCLTCLRKLPPGTFDLTITSPPYNIGKEYEQPLPADRYIAWCEQWMAELHRTTQSAGALWLNLGYIALTGIAKAIPLPYLLWNHCPFYLIQEVVWNYGAGVSSRNSLSPRNEKLLWYVKDPEHYTFHLDAIRDPDVKYPQQKKNGKLRCNTIGKNPSDVWQIAKVTSGERRSSKERTAHPAQFPLDLVNRLVVGFSNPGDLILDPFMGSGTVAVAALEHRRQVVGFEMNPTYCELAATRIRAAIANQRDRLFRDLS